jgi:hypothetical protein
MTSFGARFLILEMQCDVTFTLICRDGEVTISLPALTCLRTFNAAYFRKREYALTEQRVNLVPYNFPLPIVTSVVSLAECFSKQSKTMEEKWRTLAQYVHELNVDDLRAANRAACLMRFDELADCVLDRVLDYLTAEERSQFYCPQ